MKVKRICQTCSKPFYVNPSIIKYGVAKFCSSSCYQRTGKNNPKWRGGKITVGGYIYIHTPQHPFATKDGYVCEHRLVMETKLNRVLDRNEVIHHLNGIKNDNRIENLIVTNAPNHAKIHFKGYKQQEGHIKRRFKNRKKRDMSVVPRDKSGKFI